MLGHKGENYAQLSCQFLSIGVGAAMSPEIMSDIMAAWWDLKGGGGSSSSFSNRYRTTDIKNYESNNSRNFKEQVNRKALHYDFETTKHPNEPKQDLHFNNVT